MRITLAQLNPTIGDVAGNTALVLQAMERARRDRADVLLTSELVLIGYPPRDLLQREGVVEACEHAVEAIARQTGELYVIVGHPRVCRGGTRPFWNSASVCHRGEVLAVCNKQLLPGYDIFDEDRYFEPGRQSLVVDVAGCRVGVLICEDLWRARDVEAKRTYRAEPITELASERCDLILTLNASPFVLGKWQTHVKQLSEIAREHRVPLVAVNQIGASDDLIFDGRSVATDRDGSIIAVLPGWKQAVTTIELSADVQQSRVLTGRAQVEIDLWNEHQRELFHALALGVRDYCGKTGHNRLLIGLSGGVDSALTAVLAAAAIGPEHVHGVMMPSRYTSAESIEDAQMVAEALALGGCRNMPITSIHEAARHRLEESLECEVEGVTDENLQARLRGILLMAISNRTGGLVVSTSNKSEIATGYATLYGDMCGAIAPLGDLTKTRVYQMARWVNKHWEELGFSQSPIPENSIRKPPSAELRPNQIDQDTLPPYEILDPIIERVIEEEQSAEQIVAETGFDEELVAVTLRMIDRAQFKRDQAPVILKVTWRAFGRGRPMPIVMKQTALRPEPASGKDAESKSLKRQARKGAAHPSKLAAER